MLCAITGMCEEQSVQQGWWSQYGQMPTDDMIDYHGYPPASEDPEIDGYIAVLDCSRIGDRALISINDSVYRVRAFDCLGSDGTLSWWTDNNIIGEIDFYLAEAEDVVGQGGVRATCTWLD